MWNFKPNRMSNVKATWLSSCLFLSFLVVCATTDIYLGGLMPLDAGHYGLMHGPALMAMEHINENPSMLPGYTLKMIMKNTTITYDMLLYHVGVAVDQLHELMTSVADPPVMMLLHEGSWTETEVTAEITGTLKMIQIATGSASPVLSERERFPYFYRTIGDLADTTTMEVDLIKHFGWDRVALFNADYGPFKKIGSQLETQLREENIDVVQSLFFKANDIDKQMAKIKESGAKIILHHSSADGIEMVEVFCQAYKHGLYGKDYVWISAIQEVRNYWSHSMELSALNFTRCTVDEIVTAMESSFQTFRMDAFEAYELEQQFHMAISGRDPHRIWQEMQEQSWAQYPYIKPLYFQVAYDAVWAAALAINGSLDRIPKSVLENFTYEDLDYVTEILNQELMKLEFFGASGPVSFSKEGNRLSVIAIEQIFNGSAKAIGIYDQKTQDITWSVAANQIWRETGGKAPLAGYRQVYESRLISEIIRLTYCVVAAVAIVGAILLILFTIFKWKTKLIQNSWPVMNITIAIGCILIDISILLAGFDATSSRNAQSTCQGSTWLFILGFTLCYGTMLVKMWGIFRFYRNNVEWGIKAELRLLTAVAIMLCIDLLLLLLWQLTDPLLVFRVELAPVTNEAEGLVVIPVLFQCTSYGTMGWTIAFFTFKGLMLLVSICLIWPAWVMSIRNSIGDSSHIGLAMVCVVLAAIVGVPVSILVQDQPTVRYGVIGGFTLICTIAIVLLILVPKLIAYRKGDMEPTLLSPMRLIIDEFVEDLDSGKHNASNESRGQDGEIDAREMNVAHNVDQNEIKIENGHHSNGYF